MTPSNPSDPTDEVILRPFKERLASWEDHDVAGFFLGKALGFIPVDTPWSGAKSLFWSESPTGAIILDLIQYLVDNGVLEERDSDEYGRYRWNSSREDFM